MLQPFRALPALLFAALASAAPQQPGTLRIGTWNLEFLGATGNFRNNLPPRDDADYAAIGKKVRELGVAVLAVQEICGAEPLQKVAAGAGPTWRTLLGTSGGWDDGKTSQQIGFLYDSGAVDLVLAEELLELPRDVEGTPIFHRVPVSAVFRCKTTGCDFRAITVHLKAGQKDLDKIKRRLEASHLHTWLGNVLGKAGEDQDVVVLGDFNSTYGTEPETVLEKGGTFQYLETSPQVPTIMHFPEPIDQVVVGAGFGEVVRSSLRVHGDFGGLDKDAWRKIYSDHFPVTVELKASGDDDPAATFASTAGQLLPVNLRPANATAATNDAAAVPAANPKAAPRDDARASPVAQPKGLDSRWPPAVGKTVKVVYGMDGDFRNQNTDTGTLLEPLPSRSPGWVVIRSQGNVIRAIPYERVLYVVVD